MLTFVELVAKLSSVAIISHVFHIFYYSYNTEDMARESLPSDRKLLDYEIK